MSDAGRTEGPSQRRYRWLPRRPTLYTLGGEERHAGWLELFFDLVFVLAVAELAHYLHEHMTLAGYLGFAFLFVPVWWSWLGFSYYADQFDVEGTFFRVVMLTAMLVSTALAVNVYSAFDGGSARFAASYLLLRFMLIGLYVWAWRQVPVARALCARYVVGFSLGAALWSVSLLLPEPTRYWLWGVALFVEVATPVVAHLSILPSIPIQVSHMPERFGLFTIIVLGESIIVTGLGVADTSWRPGSVLVAVSGFVIVACLWWLYFDHVDNEVMYRSYSAGVRELLLGYFWSYAHLVIFASLTAIAVGIEFAIGEATDEALLQSTRVALCGGVGAYLLATGTTQYLSLGAIDKRAFLARLGVATGALALVPLSAALDPAVLASILALALAVLTAFETRRPTPRSAGDAGEKSVPDPRPAGDRTARTSDG